MSTMSTEDSWKTMDLKELEKQYSPSKWSKRFEPGMAQYAHLDVVEKDYTEAIQSSSMKADIRYGPTDGQKLDLFWKTPQVDAYSGKGCPIFAFFHGGYWQMLDKKQGSICVRPLTTAGCTVALIDYDLAPIASMGDIVEEVKSAAKYILDFAKRTNSSGVVFGGHSAGGHLIAMIATAKWLKRDPEMKRLIKGYICISGIYDLQPLIRTSVNELLNMNEECARRYSPVLLLDSMVESISEKCHFLVAVGEHDSAEFRRQSALFQEGLQKQGVNSALLVIPKVDHFDILENIKDSNFILTKKIIELLFDAFDQTQNGN